MLCCFLEKIYIDKYFECQFEKNNSLRITSLQFDFSSPIYGIKEIPTLLTSTKPRGQIRGMGLLK